MAPDSEYATRLGARPHLEAIAPPEMATSRENRRRVVRRDTSVHRSSRRGRTLTQPALPQSRSFSRSSAPATAISKEGPWGRHLWALRFYPRHRDRPSLRRPGARHGRPGARHGRPAGRRRPAFPLRPRRGSAGLGAAAPARERRGPGAERPPPPYLRVCG